MQTATTIKAHEKPVYTGPAYDLGWLLGSGPRNYRSFLDAACRFWMDVRLELGISRTGRTAQDTRDMFAFISAITAAWARAPLATSSCNANEIDEQVLTAAFTEIVSGASGVASLFGRHAPRPYHHWREAAEAAFQAGFRDARPAPPAPVRPPFHRM